jgi:hypothetical protein
LALIIFVVSEKKAFEHFPIGSNVNLCIAVAAILMVLYKLCVFCSGMKFKMAATAGLSLTLDPMRWRPSWISDLCRGPSNDHSWAVWFQLSKWFQTTNIIKAKLYMNVHWMVVYKLYVFCSDKKFKMAATAGLSLTGGHLGFPIGIKNIKFVEDLPMIIPGQFGFNCPR